MLFSELIGRSGASYVQAGIPEVDDYIYIYIINIYIYNRWGGKE